MYYAICVQDLDSCRLVCLPATSKQSDGTKTRQESMKLRVLASYNSCYEVIDYICSVKMVLRRQRNSSNKRWGQKRWAKGRRAALASLVFIYINAVVHDHMIMAVIWHIFAQILRVLYALIKRMREHGGYQALFSDFSNGPGDEATVNPVECLWKIVTKVWTTARLFPKPVFFYHEASWKPVEDYRPCTEDQQGHLLYIQDWEKLLRITKLTHLKLNVHSQETPNYLSKSLSNKVRNENGEELSYDGIVKSYNLTLKSNIPLKSSHTYLQ